MTSRSITATDLPAAYTDDRYVNDKKRVSSWLITVNTNKAYTGPKQGAALVSRLLGATDRIFGGNGEDDSGEFLEDVMNWIELPETDDWTLEVVRKPEIGKIQGRVHIHVQVIFRHTGRLQLHYAKLGRLYKELMAPLDGPYATRDKTDKREALFDDLGITNIYFDCQLLQFNEGLGFYLAKGEILFREEQPTAERLTFADIGAPIYIPKRPIDLPPELAQVQVQLNNDPSIEMEFPFYNIAEEKELFRELNNVPDLPKQLKQAAR
jgi:hypothetical protein